MSGTSLRFGLLGPLQMTVADRQVSVGTPKQRAVLAMLLINRNRTVGIESLMNAAWNQEPVPAARASVHSYISNLRRLMIDSGADAQAMLAAAPPGYQLAVADGDCDLDRFVAAKAAGIREAAAGRFEQASSHLSAALAQWRGPALDDLADFTFVEPISAALTEDHMVAHTAFAEAEIACGRTDTVISRLEMLVTQHRYREPLWAQLITAYYIAERQSDALAAYRRLKAVLAEDLGIDPGPTIEALHLKILRGERLDTRQAAIMTAERTAATEHGLLVGSTVAAGLRDSSGRDHPLKSPITRVGRLEDNDIVLNDIDVSRHHAVIIDTGRCFVLTDLNSANGVHVWDRRIRPSATLAQGDHVRVCGYEFTFHMEQ